MRFAYRQGPLCRRFLYKFIINNITNRIILIILIALIGIILLVIYYLFNKNEINASRRTVMQLCIGLKLSYTDAVYLMSCANYAFNPNEAQEELYDFLSEHFHENNFTVNFDLFLFCSKKIFYYF